MTEKQLIEKWAEKFKNDLLAKFTDDYIAESKTEVFNLPGKSFSITSELFGQYELLDIDGKKVIQTEDYYLAKYLLYANRTKPNSVAIPVANDEVKIIVKNYEKLLDSLVKDIIENIKVVLPVSDPLRLSNQIFNMLNIIRY